MKKVYLICESQYYHQTHELVAYATAYKTDEAARSALRRHMSEVVREHYEGCDEDIDIDEIVDEIMESAGYGNNAWWWEPDDHSVTWRIMEQEVQS